MYQPVCRYLHRYAFPVLLLASMAAGSMVGQSAGVSTSGDSFRQQATIPDTEIRTLHSKNVGQEFTIYVHLPPGYSADSATIYPVLYMTDANRAFPMVANISSVATFPKGNLPEHVLVGIGYPIKDLTEWAAWRTRDLTPTSDTAIDRNWNNRLSRLGGRKFNVRSGGAAKFLSFIVEELIPFVESQYRVSRSDRALAGYSYGGLFALYAFLTRPETFGRYFAGSPSTEYDHGVIFKYEDAFAAAGKQSRARFFLSVGSLEDSTTRAGAKTMFERLRLRDCPGGQVTFQVFEGEDHRSCMAVAINRAFRVLYGP